MKKKNFKIKRTTLFVYQKPEGSNPFTPVTETDPVTLTITLTKTGIFGGM